MLLEGMSPTHIALPAFDGRLNGPLKEAEQDVNEIDDLFVLLLSTADVVGTNRVALGVVASLLWPHLNS